MKNSGLFSLGIRDVVKGFIMSMIASILTAALAVINAGTIPTDFASWKPTLVTGLAAGIGYVVKNFLTNSNDQFAKPEPKNEGTN